jgi:CheY-like chemotaxis protein
MTSVLLAEDADLVRSALASLLAGAGYQVTEARNGHEAAAMLDRYEFDAAVMDIWMPGLDGVALLKRIRSSGNPVPVIIISGGGPKAPLELSASIAEAHGASTVIFKPFEDEELLDALQRVTAADS